MVYKPTRNQQFGVRPTGVVPATGLKNMASAIGKIADASEAIRQHDRQMRFDQAVLDAELAGKTAVKFDENDNVIPITTMEYNPNMFYGADEAKVQSVYRKALMQTYKTAFANDVTSAAENAALNNFANPEGVKAIMEEYGINVENLPEELKAEIMPTYLSAFKRSERFVRSQLMDKVKNEGIASNQLRINNIFKEKVNHYLMTSQVGETIDTHHMDRLDRELGEISEALQTLGVGKDKIAEVMAKGNTSVASAAAEGHIMREYQANGGDAIATSVEIDKIITGLSGKDQNLNLQAIESNLRNRLSLMERDANILDAEKTKQQKLNYDNYVNAIWIGSITTDEEIDSFDDITQAHRNALKAQLRGILTGNANDLRGKFNREVKEPWESESNMLIADAKNKLNTNSGRRAVFKKIMAKIKEGQELGIDVSTVYANYLTALQDFIIPLEQMDLNERLIEFKHQFSDVGGYVLRPEIFLSEEFINQNIQGGFLATRYDVAGKAKSVFAPITVAEWKALVLDYAERYDKFHKDASKFNIMFEQAKAGLWEQFDQGAIDYMRDKVGFGNLSVIDPDGGAEIRWEDALFMHNRPDVQNLAMQKLVGFATTHGVLPEDFAIVLGGMSEMMPGVDKEQQELAFGTMQRAVAQIHEAFKAKYSWNVAPDMTRSLLKFNGIDYGSYRIAKKMGFENWTNWNARKNATQPTSRNISSALPEGFNDSIEWFDSIFQHTFQNWGWTHQTGDWLKPGRDDHLTTQLRNSVKQIGTSNLEFVWNDPVVKSQIMEMSYNWLQQNKLPYNEDTMEEAIVNSMSAFGNRIGIQEIELSDGTEVAQVVVDPIHKEALKTIAPVSGIDTYADFTLAFQKDPMKYIRQDAESIWYSVDRAGVKSPDFDKVFFIPNTVVGQKNTWTVAYYEDGSFEPTVIFPDYAYDYKNSIHSLAMINAYEATKDATGLSKFFLNSGLFNTREMTKIIEKSVEQQLSPYDQTSLMVKYYNNFMASVGGLENFEENYQLIDMAKVTPQDASQFIALLKAIEHNQLPGLLTPWEPLINAYKNIPEEIKGTWLSYGLQNQTWDDARKSIWK